MQNKPLFTSALLLLMTLALSSCGLFSSKSEYDKVPPGKALEVPPDLDEPSAASAIRVPNATYSRVANGPVSAGAPVGSTTAAVEPGTRLEFAGGRQALLVDDSLESAWRRVGFALPRIGLEINDQNRDSGVYSVEYVDVAAKEQQPGRFSRWIMRKKGPTDHSGSYQVRLVAAGEQTRVQLLDEDGGQAADSVSEVILNGLLERLQ
jgi:uncharacterized lipoprotein